MLDGLSTRRRSRRLPASMHDFHILIQYLKKLRHRKERVSKEFVSFAFSLLQSTNTCCGLDPAWTFTCSHIIEFEFKFGRFRRSNWVFWMMTRFSGNLKIGMAAVAEQSSRETFDTRRVTVQVNTLTGIIPLQISTWVVVCRNSHKRLLRTQVKPALNPWKKKALNSSELRLSILSQMQSVLLDISLPDGDVCNDLAPPRHPTSILLRTHMPKAASARLRHPEHHRLPRSD